MKKIVFFYLIMMLGYSNSYAQNVPVDLMIGFATMNGGTRGGLGGDSIIVNNLKDFKKYAGVKDTAYVILVSGRISSGDDKGASIKVASNKSIIGIGADAFLDGIGLN